LLREHRLYQADWLLRFYGFQAAELLSEAKPNFNILLDPKADWALRHLENFPIEVNHADYQTILRVPGIGVKSAQRIIRARKSGILRFEDLKKIGVVLKRALYFITCGGKMMYNTKIEEDYITRNLLTVKERLPFDKDGVTYKQLSLFDDVNFQPPEIMTRQLFDGQSVVLGQL
ncbi:MAG: helix-hairpin-helix domain-containing protein, partial [Lachnospiraceae bacterium]|nr:helix-hairpin-helix domain-containing protein [Lachnospiraceae bacterium]